jgi:hypothetical protein
MVLRSSVSGAIVQKGVSWGDRGFKLNCGKPSRVGRLVKLQANKSLERTVESRFASFYFSAAAQLSR